MVDLNTEFGALVKRRLQEDEVVWFTTVNPRGFPSPNPVWFFWDGEFIIVYSQPESYRVRNIRQNPNVALHFQGADAQGQNVVVMNGESALLPYYTTVPAGYWKKYSRYLPDLSLTADEFMAQYSIEIRTKLLRVRGD